MSTDASTAKQLLSAMIPVLLILLLALLTAVAPEERQLGAAIRTVFLHVALSRAGLIGLLVAGLAGLAALITAREDFSRMARALATSALIIFALGFAVSVVAQLQSWNGLALREPRVLLAMNEIAVAVIALVLAAWLKAPRLSGALLLALAIFVAWGQLGAENVLHPGEAISESGSAAIRFTGLALQGLSLGLWAWGSWWLLLWERSAASRPLADR